MKKIYMLLAVIILSITLSGCKENKVNDQNALQETQQETVTQNIKLQEWTPEFYLNQIYQNMTNSDKQIKFNETTINWYWMFDKTFKATAISWVWATWLNIEYDWMKINDLLNKLWFQLDANQWADWVSETLRWYKKENIVCTIHMIMKPHEYKSQMVDILCWNIK